MMEGVFGCIVMTNPFGEAILNFVVMVIDIDILFYWNFSETSQKKKQIFI